MGIRETCAMSRALTRQQLMAWRENWNVTDRVLIEHAIDLLPERDYYEPTSAQYVGARVAGRVALYVAPGYIYWPKPTWSADIDPALIPGGLCGGEEQEGRWYELSTFQQRGSSEPRFEELNAPCPGCFLVPSVSGACGCD
jgi:hypothetical protein